MAFTSTHKKAIDIIVPFLFVGAIAVNYIGRKGDRDIRYIVFVMVLGGLAVYAITASITKMLLARALAGLKPKDQEAVIKDNGIDKNKYDQIETKAKTIYGAFHDSRWTEDEDLAIDTFNSLSTPTDVKVLCQIYQKLYGLSVKAEFDEYVTAADLFVNGLKAVVTDNWF